MKSYKQYLSAFVVCLLLFVTFSTSVAADSIDNTLIIYQSYGRYYNATPTEDAFYMSSYSYWAAPSYETKSGQAITGTTKTDTFGKTGANPVYQDPYMDYKISIYDSQDGLLVKEGQETNLEIKNFFMKAYALDDSVGWIPRFDHLVHLRAGYRVAGDTEIYEIYNPEITFAKGKTGTHHNITFDFTAPADIYEIVILFSFHAIDFFNMPSSQPSMKLTMGSMDMVTIETNSETGLLKGIIEWLKGIFEGITELPARIWEKIEGAFNSVIGFLSSIVDYIKELPAKIWEFIENGLKDLFVPDEEYMSNYADIWDLLLQQRFGAIYEVGTIIIDFWDNLSVSDATNSIELPIVDLSSNGIPFSFGGYNVKIIPDGFETVVEVLKKIISIACTFLFINGLRHRYDEVMGVEK